MSQQNKLQPPILLTAPHVFDRTAPDLLSSYPDQRNDDDDYTSPRRRSKLKQTSLRAEREQLAALQKTRLFGGKLLQVHSRTINYVSRSSFQNVPIPEEPSSSFGSFHLETTGNVIVHRRRSNNSIYTPAVCSRWRLS